MAKTSSLPFVSNSFKRIFLAFPMIGLLSLGNFNGASGSRNNSYFYFDDFNSTSEESGSDNFDYFQKSLNITSSSLFLESGNNEEDTSGTNSTDEDWTTGGLDYFQEPLNTTSSSLFLESGNSEEDPFGTNSTDEGWTISVIAVDASPTPCKDNVEFRRLLDELQKTKRQIEDLQKEAIELRSQRCDKNQLGDKKKISLINRYGSGWLGNFEKEDTVNPILGPQSDQTFYCPIRKTMVSWEKQGVYNPAAIVKDDKIYLLYRAEDDYGRLEGTSRIGLAVSSDGLHFVREKQPVLYPANDNLRNYEWDGGCENPRIVEGPNGNYIMLYNGYGGVLPRLMVATSKDLRKWQKHGLAFKGFNWSTKNGAIVTKLGTESGKFIPTKINGKYWMYWHAHYNIYVATSDNLIDWVPIKSPVMSPRPGMFDGHKVEPGPQAVVRDDGILLIYNGIRRRAPVLDSDSDELDQPLASISVGQALFSLSNPAKLLSRMETPFIEPDRSFELNGKTNNVVFAEGLVYFKNKWMLYYGAADSRVGVAISG